MGFHGPGYSKVRLGSTALAKAKLAKINGTVRKTIDITLAIHLLIYYHFHIPILFAHI